MTGSSLPRYSYFWLQETISQGLEVLKAFAEFIRAKKCLAVELPEEVLGWRVTFSIVAAEAGCDHIAIAIPARGPRDHMLDNMIRRIKGPKTIETSTPLTHENEQPIMWYREEIHFLKRQCGGGFFWRYYAWDL